MNVWPGNEETIAKSKLFVPFEELIVRALRRRPLASARRNKFMRNYSSDSVINRAAV